MLVMPYFPAQGDREIALFMSNFARHLPALASECNISPAELDEYLGTARASRRVLSARFGADFADDIDRERKEFVTQCAENDDSTICW